MSLHSDKAARLRAWLGSLKEKNLVVAFSGGVDSTLLLKLAAEAAVSGGKKAYGVYFSTMLHPAAQEAEARGLAEDMQAEFLVISVDELAACGIEDNPPDRCYRCKRFLMSSLLDRVREDIGESAVLEGTNADDLLTFRPGFQAVKELKIYSPLADFHITKDEVRQIAADYGISVARKPAMPCMATRFPYGTRLTQEKMKKAEEGEAYVRNIGFRNVRWRVFEDLVKIEVDSEDLESLLLRREALIKKSRELGYRHITVDLEGFRSGSMDEDHIVIGSAAGGI